MIRVGTPQKYKPTKSSKLPKPQKIRPTKITNHTVCGTNQPQLKYMPLVHVENTCVHIIHTEFVIYMQSHTRQFAVKICNS